MIEYFIAVFLGFIEGLTEFIPVSSTGHLILLTQGLNFPAPPGHIFEVFIQIGAILAVMVLYRQKIFQTIRGLGSDRTAQSFALNIVIGTIPALLLGGLLHEYHGHPPAKHDIQIDVTISLCYTPTPTR